MGREMTRLLARRDLTIASIVLLFTLQAFIRFSSHLNPDVAWYLYASGRLLDGARLYVDVVEVSPPFGLWLSMPIVAIARAINVDGAIAFHAVLLMLAVVSVALSARFIAAATDISPGARNLFLVLLAGLMLFLPASDFGLRDHLIIVFATPWVLLRWNRFVGHEVHWALAAFVGLLAACGFWTNPIFLVVILGVELTILFASQSVRAVIKVETLVIAAVGVAYFIALWLSAFTNLTQIALLNIRAYIPIYGVAFEETALRVAAPAALAALAIASSNLMMPKVQLLRVLLIVVGVGFIFVFFIQSGFRHQVIPALFFLTLAVGLGVARAGAGEITFFNPFEKIVVVAATVSILSVFVSIWSIQFVPYQGRAFERVIADEAPQARSFFIASTEAFQAFPLVEEKQLVWASRFPSQWLASHSSENLDKDGAPVDGIGSYLLESTVDDLIKFEPDIVFVNENSVRRNFTEEPLDYVEFWQTDRRFRSFWRGYRRLGVVKGFGVFVRRGNR